MTTTARSVDRIDLQAMFAAYEEGLREYPGNLVLRVLSYRREFWPTLKELLDDCDMLMPPKPRPAPPDFRTQKDPPRSEWVTAEQAAAIIAKYRETPSPEPRTRPRGAVGPPIDPPARVCWALPDADDPAVQKIMREMEDDL